MVNCTACTRMRSRQQKIIFVVGAQAERLRDSTPKRIFVDRGYRGHNYADPADVHVARRGLRKMKPSLKQWLKRRSAVEPVISNIKTTDGWEETTC
jgi:hypothetical protein